MSQGTRRRMFFDWHSRGHEGDEGYAGPPPKAMKAIKAIKDMARRRAADGSATGPARPRMYVFLEGGTDGQRNDLQSRFLEIGLYSVTNYLSTLGSLRTYRPGDGAHLRYS